MNILLRRTQNKWQLDALLYIYLPNYYAHLFEETFSVICRLKQPTKRTAHKHWIFHIHVTNMLQEYEVERLKRPKI